MTIAPLDRAVLARATADPVRGRLAGELPALAREPAALARELDETGLLGSLDALYAVRVGRATLVAEVWAPDRPPIATTLRIGLGPLDRADDASAPARALDALVRHVVATTAAARIERAVFADDLDSRAACEHAGLALESVRREAGLRDGRPADMAVYVRLRRPERVQTRRVV